MAAGVRLTRRSVLALAATVTLSPASAADETYVNPRFGTRVTYPADIFLHPQRPSENGDGMSWESDDGAWLGVWGQFNALEQDEKALLAFLEPEYGEVTYKKAGKGFVVLSGYDDGKVFYLRTNFGSDGVLHTMLLRYPKALKSRYDTLVGPIAASLRGP